MVLPARRLGNANEGSGSSAGKVKGHSIANQVFIVSPGGTGIWILHLTKQFNNQEKQNCWLSIRYP